jgi:hypothetical protein
MGVSFLRDNALLSIRPITKIDSPTINGHAVGLLRKGQNANGSVHSV